jgi:hypothetical protein
MWMPRARLFHYVIIFHAASTNYNTIMSLFTFQFCTLHHSLDYEEWIMMIMNYPSLLFVNAFFVGNAFHIRDAMHNI